MFEQWLTQLMQPGNSEALVEQLAQKGAPPTELLESIGRQGPPQMSQIPGTPGSFAGMLQQAGAPGQVPMQPSPDGQTLQPVPPPQMTVDPNAQPMQQPLQFGPQAASAEPQGLTAEQSAALLQRKQQELMRPPSAPGLMGGGAVREPQMLQVQNQGPRLSLAQLLYGR